MTKENTIPKNLILYGPPGTGKTYNTIAYAVSIIVNNKMPSIENGVLKVTGYDNRQDLEKKFNELKENNLVEFCTFHQSYSYEEFIEGIKPDLYIDDITNAKNILYKIEDGIFKKFCQTNYLSIDNPNLSQTSNITGLGKSPTVWKIILKNVYDNDVRSDCMTNNRIRIGFDENYKTKNEILKAATDKTAEGRRLNAFINDLKVGDIVISYRNNYQFDNIGVVETDWELDPKFDSYNIVRTVKWQLDKPTLRSMDLIASSYQPRGTLNRMPNANLKAIIENINKSDEQVSTSRKNKVFIIDEINRGNISKIFGELITLIEDTKRTNWQDSSKGLRIKLPYSHAKGEQPFGVPDNIYILGTMNTADRSIALIDTALRRRFKFIEMAPQFSLLENIEIAEVNGNKKINIKNMMDKINERIEILYDRDHKIGHSFFMKLTNNSTINDLAEIFEYDIIPLLQEYFYNDWEKIAAILGDKFEPKYKTYNFINRLEVKDDIVRKYDMDKVYTYSLNKDAFAKSITYRKIYDTTDITNTTQESTQDEE